MKYLLLALLSLHTLYANNVNNADAVTIHSSSVYLIMLFLVLALIVTYAFFIYKCNKIQKLLDEKNKVITSHKKKEREDELLVLNKNQEVEKEILSLQHTIADLERHIQEGTKNQVVLKIEALQKKRQNSTRD